jgi:16S rRNA pseudouridine516 synthase
MAKEKMRLDRLLANMGVGTRREVKKILKECRVAVDGVVTTDPGISVDPGIQRIKVDGTPIVYQQYVYFVDLVAEEYGFYQPFPVGRLDKDTEGLIFLTNDGTLAHGLTSPRNHVPKVYYVEVDGPLISSDIDAVKTGIDLDDFTTMPGHLEILTSGERSSAHLTIYEGKFHQVKRMMAALGKHVTYLKRLSIGSLQLDPQLKTGEYRALTEQELAALRSEICKR